MGERITLGRFGLVALAVMFVITVTLTNGMMRGLRLDLTENRLYTLSDGTYRILENIPEPINLYFYYSDRATANIPALRAYAGRVEEMLQEFAQNSAGKLTVRFVDPLPFSEDEDRAAAFGLQELALPQASDPVYFGIAGTNSVGDEEILPFLEPSKEAFLEYDLAKLIHTLSVVDRPVIGLLSGLQMTAGFDPATQQMTQPWVITDQISQLFELRTLAADAQTIDADIDVLMVVHPSDLSSGTLYALDQFILAGGRALLLVDPYAEADRQAPPVPGMPSAGGSSSLNALINAWGLSVDPENVVGDDRLALTVSGMGNQPVRYLPLLGLDATSMNREDVVTAGVDNLNLGFAGHISVQEDAPVTVTPLLESSDLAAEIPAAGLGMLQDPDTLRAGFTPTGETFLLAARVQGNVPSAFPAGPPALPDSDLQISPDTGHLAESAEPINAILVADTDLLTDRLWVQVQPFLGQRLLTAFAGNADFISNALDNLSGSNDLISIRGRATYTRPFTRVQELQREAEARFRNTERQLQEELTNLETKLAELETGASDDNLLLVNPAQQAELERFQEERLRIRRELRQVQRDLDQEIEDLGTRLTVINTFLIPLILTGAALALVVIRRRRRASEYARRAG